MIEIQQHTGQSLKRPKHTSQTNQQSCKIIELGEQSCPYNLYRIKYFVNFYFATLQKTNKEYSSRFEAPTYDRKNFKWFSNFSQIKIFGWRCKNSNYHSLILHLFFFFEKSFQRIRQWSSHLQYLKHRSSLSPHSRNSISSIEQESLLLLTEGQKSQESSNNKRRNTRWWF